MNTLPIELQMMIVGDMSSVEIVRLSRVNSDYYKLCKNESLWWRLVYRDFRTDVTQFCGLWYETYKIYYKFNSVYDVCVTDGNSDNKRIIITARSKELSICHLILQAYNLLMINNELVKYIDINKYPRELINQCFILPIEGHLRVRPLRNEILTEFTNSVLSKINFDSNNVNLVLLGGSRRLYISRRIPKEKDKLCQSMLSLVQSYMNTNRITTDN